MVNTNLETIVALYISLLVISLVIAPVAKYYLKEKAKDKIKEDRAKKRHESTIAFTEGIKKTRQR